MSLIHAIGHRLRMWLRFSEVERELDAELLDHFEREVERQRAGGAPEADARRLAALRVGNVESLKEQARDERGGRLAADLVGDLRVGWRGLRRSPGFAAAVVLSLALGVAGVTSIFSIVNAVIIRPLPYPDPERLHLVRVAWNAFTAPLSSADFLHLRDQSRGVADVGAYWLNTEGFTLLGGPEPEVVVGANVTVETPRVLGVTPVLGRWFSDAADAREVLISSAIWRDRFGGRADVLGQQVMLDGVSQAVVGVMPPGFNLPGQDNAHLWVLAHLRPPERRGPFFLSVVVRLTAGVGPEPAGLRLTSAITPSLLDRFGAEPGWRYEFTPLKDVAIGDVRATLLLLLAAVALVLLISCANVANLLLARGATRLRELAMRAALGARRERLMRQLLAESALAGVAGAAIGLAAATVVVRVMIAQTPGVLPRVQEIRVDAVAALVAAAAGLASALVAGALPAVALTGRRLQETIRDGGRGAIGGPREGRARRAIVAAEIALTLAVLVATTLLTKTMVRLEAEDPGFRSDGVLAFRLVLPPEPYADTGRLETFLDRLDERLRAIPGVMAVAIAESLPPDQLQQSNNYTLDGDEPGRTGRGAQGSGVAQWNVVGPEYFRALGIPLEQGRAFGAEDRVEAPRVAVVSESFARHHFGKGDAIGRRFKGGDWDAAAPWTTIVGVVGDVPYVQGIWGGRRPTIYVAHQQDAGSRWQFVVVRAAEGAELAPAITRTVQQLDPRVPLRDVRTMDERRRASAAVPRFRMMLFALLAAVAVALAVTGIYGVLAYHVSQRRRETAIRRALGAPALTILGAVVRSGLTLTAAGSAAGLLLGWMLVQGLAGFLYGVEVHDAWAFVGGTGILVASALAASVVPAVRALAADPLSALRED